jgi:hypothetical protein
MGDGRIDLRAQRTGTVIAFRPYNGEMIGSALASIPDFPGPGGAVAGERCEGEMMVRKLLMAAVFAFCTLAAAGTLAPAQAWVAGWHAGWHGGCCWRAGWWGHPGWGWGWGHPGWAWRAGWGWGPGWGWWGVRPGGWVWLPGRGWVWR